MPYSIYALIDPRDTSFRYIGFSNDLTERLICHLRMVEVNRQKNAWVAELKNLGLVPICRTLQVCVTEYEAREAERNWIEGFITAGETLFNVESYGRQR